MSCNLKSTLYGRSLLTAALLLCSTAVNAQKREDLAEPVYRVVNTTSKVATDRGPAPTRPELDSAVLPPMSATTDLPPHAAGKHPALLAALKDADVCLGNIEDNIRDYSCLFIRRENVNGNLLKPEYIYTKIRQQQVEGEKVVVPFSVYMKYLKPEEFKGREVIYIEGQNDGKMLVKEGGMRGKFLPSIWLAPTCSLVMNSCRYPITDVGLQTLTEKLIERADTNGHNVPDEDYVAEYREGAKLNGRKCKYLKVDFLTRKPTNEASRMEIFIDKDRMVPIRYVAYGWPKPGAKKPPVIEEYTYLKLELNKSFTDEDFDPENPNYNF